MTGDAADLHQVSFNQSDDFDPVVLDNGKIMFSRWDHAGNINGIHLYQMNPDGTGLELLYGAESHLTGTNNGQVQFIGAREMQDGRIMAIVRPFDHPELGGAITIIDAKTYVENTQPIAQFPGMTGPAQTAATPNQVRTDDLPVEGRALQLGVPAVGRHGPRARELGDLPCSRSPIRPIRRATLFVPCTDAHARGPDRSIRAAVVRRVDVRSRDADPAADRDRRGRRADRRRRCRATAQQSGPHRRQDRGRRPRRGSRQCGRRHPQHQAASTTSTAWLR